MKFDSDFWVQSFIYSWVGAVVGILGGFLAWIGGKTYANANKIVTEKLEGYVKISDYKDDVKELKDDIKQYKNDIKANIKSLVEEKK